MERDVVAPGDSVKLTINFSTKSYRSRVTKSPAIYTNADTLHGVYRVQIMAEVVTRPDSLSPVVVEPHKLDLSPFNSLTRDSISFSLENVTPRHLSLIMIDFPSDLMQVSIPGRMRPNQEAEGTVVLTAKGRSGEFWKSITFETDNPEGTRYTIPVKRRVREGWAPAAPERTCVEPDSVLDSP